MFTLAHIFLSERGRVSLFHSSTRGFLFFSIFAGTYDSGEDYKNEDECDSDEEHMITLRLTCMNMRSCD